MSLIAGWLEMPWYVLVPGAMVVGWISQEVCRAFAVALGLLDHPNSRKIHTRPVPLSGGPGIFLPLFLLYIVWMLQGAPGMGILSGLAVGTAFAGIFLTGVIDDVRGISAKKRLVIQALAALLLWSAGFRLDVLQLGGWSLSFGLLSLPITLFWFMGFMNTSNMMDGMDGLSGGMNLIAYMALATFGLAASKLAGSLTLLLAISTLVFLFFNMSGRKKVFLGDSGSLILGLGVALLGLQVARQGAGAPLHGTPVLLALAAYAIGIVDVCYAIYRRYKNGDSPFKADKRHIHHLLHRSGLGKLSTLATLHGLAGMAVFLVALPYYATPLLMLHFCVSLAMVVGAGWRLVQVNLPRHSVVVPLEHNWEGSSSSTFDEAHVADRKLPVERYKPAEAAKLHVSSGN